MANSHVLISSQTLSTATSLITFSSIPPFYKDLFIVFNGSVTSITAIVIMNFNSDAGNNMTGITLTGNGASAISQFQAASIYFYAGYGFDSVTTSRGITAIHIFDYASTDKHKTILSRSNDPSASIAASSGRWASTAAINTLTLSPNNATTFSVGSTFYLYGIAG